MNKEGKYNVVLIEPSEIVATGIASIINSNPQFNVVQTLNDPSYYNSNDSDVDIVVINPTVVDYNDRLDIRSWLGTGNTALVALTHSNYEESVLRQYDECIGIYDNTARIIQKLKNAIDENSKNPKTTSTNSLHAKRTYLQQLQWERRTRRLPMNSTFRYTRSSRTAATFRRNWV